MTVQKFFGLVFILVFLACGITILGCCESEKKEVQEMASRVAELEKEIAANKSRIGEVEENARNCKADLEGAKSRLEKLGQQGDLIEKRNETVKKLLSKLKKVIEAGDLAVRIRRGRMVLELPSAVLFESGKADLSDKGKSTLDSVAEVLGEIRDRKFQVAGHTDNVAVSEDNPFGNNWHLSTARAVQVVLYLKEKGMKPKNLSAAGYAQYQPVSSNKSKRGKARNRRIEITLMPNLAELPDLSALEKNLGLADPDEEASE